MLPTDAEDRKRAPMCRGLLDYFPDACAAVAALSLKATEQHHPDQPMHWDRSKSTDHADCIVRHLVERGTFDTDGVLHDVKVAWRALAMVQLALEDLASEGCLRPAELRRAPWQFASRRADDGAVGPGGD